MNLIGRVLGLAFGWFAGGPFGALVGFVVGLYFDRALARFNARFNPEQRHRIEQALFNCVFPLLGRMAKADGRVSEQEINTAEAMMEGMRLPPESRQVAIALFKEGTAEDFDIDAALTEFLAICGTFPDIKRLLIVYLISMAMSDGGIHEAEAQILRHVASRLGYSGAAFEHLLRMAQAQEHFYRGGDRPQQQPRQDELELAYQALGVQETATDTEVKRAYRKLMSQYHPDKLMGQGVPDEMLAVATERSQEIQLAYDMVKKSRGEK